MISATVQMSQGTRLADDPQWKAAVDLQTAFIAEMLKHGGFGDALSTGDDSLDALTTYIIDDIAADLSRQNTQLADAFYRQMNREQ